ncbi:araC family transcriptional regulator [Oceanococcus atlanticus]|uniref:AraC family transcriptional regulator n=1 Tax=Oceanococcus atlanticus TaxID=1317117 RepID=A0A1Y1SDL9_9GAMM|nr:AraC family transcriptional regulator [Oceanococcus atlanticus]ORE87096.1 araC family transcriptional regulator [Oceanococcus atlanticus]RZO86843.1 MAG: AraC family transcriptional regulator [Oceanococcus sp.]
MSNPTVIRRFSQALVEAAERLGIATPQLACEDDRVRLDVHDALWQQLSEASDDPLIGLQLAVHLQVGHLDVAGLLLMSCETLGEALEMYIEYHPIVSQGGEVWFHHVDGLLALCYTGHYDVCREARSEMSLGYAIHLARWCSGGRFEPDAVEFRHAPLDDPDRYRALLGCPVHFESAEDRLLFRSDMLDLPLIQANPALRDQLRGLADQMLSRLGEKSLSITVSELVQQHPQLSKDDIASLLAISGRHLSRKLAEEGFSFKHLRDRELQVLAMRALQRGDKIAAISAELGFSDESAFSRSFRRWTGMSPSRYRT